MNYFVDSLTKKWWYSFNEGLLGETSIDRLQNKIVITLEAKHQKKNEKQYLYGYFDNPEQLYNYIQKIPLCNRHFYEKIIGRFPQKPHFDIDIDLTIDTEMNEEIFNDLITEMVQLIDASLIERNIQIDIYRDILIFTSHSEKKLSGHLIIDHYCHNNHKEAYGFFQDVTKRMTTDYVKFIDPHVYRSTQDFRLLGSTKYGKNRYKIFRPKWLFNGIEVEYVEDDPFSIFKSSLVSWVEDCTIIPPYEPQEVEKVDPLYYNTFDYLANMMNKNKNDNNYQYDSTPLTAEEVKRAIAAVKKYYLEELKFSYFPFKFSRVSGRIISFKRLRPSLCPICSQVRHNVDNIHTSITPFLIINKKGVIKYRCYQDQTKTFIIIKNDIIESSSINHNQSNKSINHETTNNTQIASINSNIYTNYIQTELTNIVEKNMNKNSEINTYLEHDQNKSHKKNITLSKPKKKIIINVEEKMNLMKLKSRYSNDIIALDKKIK